MSMIQLVAVSLHRPEIAERLYGLFKRIRQQKEEEWKAARMVNEQGDDGEVLVRV